MILLGTNPTVRMDLDKLVTTRLMVAAMSGAGKSWALRRILEQTHGKIQQIVIDPEGEFYTLREKYDYVLARPKGEGDCPAEPRSAGMLATSLLELGVSAVLDIYELKPKERVLFVKNFLTELVNAPKRLWHRALIVIDEAAMFCPQDKDAESSEAVMDLMTLGRKRGFCGLLAVQRISMVHKNAIASATNYMIGRATLDVDVQRACKTLGFSKKADQMRMRRLCDGEFFAYGPAMRAEGDSLEVVSTHIGGVGTTHPKAGTKAPPPVPPRAAIQKMLGKLADIPVRAEKKLQTEKELRSEITGLRRDLRKAQSSAPQPIDPAKLQAEYQRGFRDAQKQAAAQLSRADAAFRKINCFMDSAKAAIPELEQPKEVMPVPPNRGPYAKPKGIRPPSLGAGVAKSEPGMNGNRDLKPSERKVLIALAQHSPVDNAGQLAAFAGYTVNGHFNNMLGRLRSQGLMTPPRQVPLEVTEEGIAAAGAFEPLPVGEELREYWLQKVKPSAAKILGVLFESYPETLDTAELATRAGYTVNGHFNNMVGSLRTMGLITPARQPIKAMDHLFEKEQRG